MLFLFFLRNITVAIIAEKIINLTVTDVDKGLYFFCNACKHFTLMNQYKKHFTCIFHLCQLLLITSYN